MRIDATHRKWFLGTCGLLVIATAIYIPYSLSPPGARGGSALGLIYGVAGFACMIFAGLLSVRKQHPVWRVGRAQTWMRGHLWLGLVSLPLILFHGGFRLGGLLTSILMVLLIVTVISGIIGAALQHYLPRVLTQQVQMETIYDQIDRVRGQLLAEADQIVDDICSTAAIAAPDVQNHSAPTSPVAVITGVDVQTEEFQNFYRAKIRTYLERRGKRGLEIASPVRAAATFRNIRTWLPSQLHKPIAALEDICEEKRQLDRQTKLHRVLHGWLLLHIPLSFALLMLGLVHAVAALRY